MKTANCGDLMRLSIPAVRCALAHKLTSKYGMDQSQIASSMGISQAAVNKYLSGKCSIRISKLGDAVLSKGMISAAMIHAAASSETERLNRLIDQVASGEGMMSLIKAVLGIEVPVSAGLHIIG